MRGARLITGLATLVSLSALISACTAPATPKDRSGQNAPLSKIETGHYLVNAGDCLSCHTSKGGKPFAGGLALHTPFGIIHSPNITPDKTTGIGNWSEKDFYNAMHLGRDNKGKHLYPAFPYPWFTRVSRTDSNAIKTYLDTLTPVKQQNKPNKLEWPLSWRISVAAWNLLYFTAGQFKPDPKQSSQWNRGAYLVRGLGHCGECHSPKNRFGASKKGTGRLTGGVVGKYWFAPSLSDNLRQGIGNWSVPEIVRYLKTGSNDKSATAGPMTEVVMNSTRYLSNSDLNAIAVYLKDMTQSDAAIAGKTASPGLQTLSRGHSIYMYNCAGCHKDNGGGVPHFFPPLKGSAAVQAENASTVIHVILAGASITPPSTIPTGIAMPEFDRKLDNQQISDVVNYIRNAWGNRGSLVSPGAVFDIRKSLKKSTAKKTYRQTIGH
ncbi:MAG: c-type cytochrome [Leptospirales bacterium]